MQTLKIAPEYGYSPLWAKTTESDFAEPVEPENIPLSQILCHLIHEWDKKFQDTFNDAYPPDSAFGNSNDEAEYEQEGRLIFEMISSELQGKWTVIYRSK